MAINPNRETAYRYWGDCLVKEGKAKEAEAKYIEAIIAEPYQRTPRVGLKQWADLTNAMLAAPPIKLPARPQVDAKGITHMTVDPSTLGDPTSSAWLGYSMNPALWQNKKFKEAYPTETTYRHSLAEEADSLRLVLVIVKEKKIAPDKLDPTIQSLMALEKDGMLECWILLDHPDEGIAQDYVAYREGHRDLMRAYVAKYDVHPK